MAASPTSVVRFTMPGHASPVVRGKVTRSDQVGVSVGEGVIALSGGVNRLVALANNRQEIYVEAVLEPNSHATGKLTDPWFAAKIISEHTSVDSETSPAIVKIATFTYVMRIDGEDIATIVLLDEDHDLSIEVVMGIPMIKISEKSSASVVSS